MHFTTDIKTYIKKIGIGTVFLGALFALIFFLLGSLNLASVLGIVIGCFIAFFNFFLLALTLQKALRSETNAKALVSLSYTGRILFQMGLAIIAIVFLQVNPISVLVPLIFPRITIFYLQITKQAILNGGDQNGCAD